MSCCAGGIISFDPSKVSGSDTDLSNARKWQVERAVQDPTKVLLDLAIAVTSESMASEEERVI